MGFMSAYYVLAVLLHALPNGGTLRRSWVLQLCFKPIDGFLTGKKCSVLQINYVPIVLKLNSFKFAKSVSNSITNIK